MRDSSPDRLGTVSLSNVFVTREEFAKAEDKVRMDRSQSGGVLTLVLSAE
jgi:hypothetical protein